MADSCDDLRASERSSAWLERVVWVHEVAGSNPVAPTMISNGLKKMLPQNLSLNLTAWQALAEIGRALQVLASAHSGEGDLCALTLPPHTAPDESLPLAALSEFSAPKPGAVEPFLDSLCTVIESTERLARP